MPTAVALDPPRPRTDPDRLVLACRDLSKVYRRGEVDGRALDGVDFALHAGELLVH